jgi:uncharacterized delta-60 repeat protein
MTTLKTLAFVLTLVACGDVANGPTAPAGDDDPMMPDAAVPAMFTLSVSQQKVPIVQGTSATVTVTVERVAPFAGAVVVNLGGLPAGATASPVTIPAGETTATITIDAGADAPHSLPTEVVAIGAADNASAMTGFTVTVCGKPGALDTSFAGGKVLVDMGISDDYGYAVAVQPDGKVLVAGTIAEHQGDFALLRLTRDGAPDPTFGAGGKVFTDFAGFTDTIYAIAVQDDGKIVVAGTSIVAGSSFDFAAARYLPDGTLDNSFGGDGKVTTALSTDIDIARALAIQPDGKIVVAGESSRGYSSTGLDFALVRYNSDGSLDGTWGTGLVVTPMKAGAGRDVISGLALQTIDHETRVVAVGGDGDFAIARYRANGALDTTFGTGGKVMGLYGSVIGMAHAAAVTASNGLFVAGQADHDFAIVKLTQAGQVDTSFGKIKTAVSSTNEDGANALAIDGNYVVAAGWMKEGMTSSANFTIVRYDATGHLDTAFGDKGIAVTPIAAAAKTDFGMAMALQADDRVPTVRAVIGGYASTSNFDFAVARYWR